MSRNQRIILILNNIRSTHNVGSLFRTASTLAIEKIYLVGVTPTPIDRFGRARKDIAKVALGAENQIPWEHKEDILPLLEELKNDGFYTIAIEQDVESVDYKSVSLKEQTAFILGEEVFGIPKEILTHVDCIAEIPLATGGKESLNVAIAGAIALFRIVDR